MKDSSLDELSLTDKICEHNKIIIALHKQYEVPAEQMYLPVHVGASLGKELGYQKDNEGENISDKNPNFCVKSRILLRLLKFQLKWDP